MLARPGHTSCPSVTSRHLADVSDSQRTGLRAERVANATRSCRRSVGSAELEQPPGSQSHDTRARLWPQRCWPAAATARACGRHGDSARQVRDSAPAALRRMGLDSRYRPACPRPTVARCTEPGRMHRRFVGSDSGHRYGAQRPCACAGGVARPGSEHRHGDQTRCARKTAPRVWALAPRRRVTAQPCRARGNIGPRRLALAPPAACHRATVPGPRYHWPHAVDPAPPARSDRRGRPPPLARAIRPPARPNHGPRPARTANPGPAPDVPLTPPAAPPRPETAAPVGTRCRSARRGRGATGRPSRRGWRWRRLRGRG
jgi:hypothetical protein